MEFIAKSMSVPFSPYKLRPLVDALRGHSVLRALQWLSVNNMQRTRPIKKVIESAIANAYSTKGIEKDRLIIKMISVDQARSIRYYKPGAMGRSSVQRRRFSHIAVILKEQEDVKA